MPEATGLIHTIFDVERYGDFHKRVFWVQQIQTEKRKYPSVWEFEFWHDDTFELNAFRNGDPVKVSFDVVGKLKKNRSSNREFVINTLKAWKIEKVSPSELEK